MTNFEIITNEAVQKGLFTKEEAEQILMSGSRLPIHTYAEWKRMGYQVRKGEKAKLSCRIWRHKNKPESEQENIAEQDAGYYMTNAHFFMLDQVEKISA